MKTLSYSSMIMGLCLLGIEYTYLFDDLLGYLITILGGLFVFFGIFINKKYETL